MILLLDLYNLYEDNHLGSNSRKVITIQELIPEWL